MGLRSDLLLSPPSMSAMRYLAQCEAALYRGELSLWIGPGASNLRRISALDPPGVWAWEVNGETIVACPGTTSALELAQQSLGWADPTITDDGAVNSYYHSLANDIWPSLPNHVDVIVGHSMGAALAMLLGRRHRAAGLALPVVFGFGCPRFVTDLFAGDGDWSPIVSLVNEFDPVPLIPPDVFAGPRWRTPPRTEWLIRPEGLTQRSQSISTHGSLAALAGAVGDHWHSCSTYISLLGDFPVAADGPAVTIGAIGMVPIYKFQVLGKLGNEDCQNVLCYRPETVTPVPTMADAMESFRTIWRSNVLPRVNAKYTVRQYRLFRNPSILIRATDEPEIDNYLWRWEEVRVEAGVAADAGSRGEAANLPSYAAVNMERTCGRWVRNDVAQAFLPQQKVIRSSMRIGGLAEADSVNDGDDLSATALAQFVVVGEVLRNYNSTHFSGRVQQVVISKEPDGAAVIEAGPPAVAIPCYADVIGFAPEVVLTTQRSRKKSATGN